jgi:hypothetical protein
MLTTFLAAIMEVYNLNFALKKEKEKIVTAEAPQGEIEVGAGVEAEAQP